MFKDITPIITQALLHVNGFTTSEEYFYAKKINNNLL